MKPLLACSKTPSLNCLNYPVLVSPKLDGIRCLIVNGKAVSRSMKPIPNNYIRNWLETHCPNGFDGELMIAGDFNKVQSVIMSHSHAEESNFYFNVFDCFLKPNDPFDFRQAKIESIIEYLSSYSTKIRYVYNKKCDNSITLKKLWDSHIKQGYEGSMVRDPKGIYKFGRSTLREGILIKLKIWHEEEAEVIGIEELMHNADTSTDKLENKIPGNRLGAFIVKWDHSIFNIGSGFTHAQSQWFWDNPDKVLGKKITFKYQELSSYGVPRFPIFKAIRKDL